MIHSMSLLTRACHLFVYFSDMINSVDRISKIMSSPQSVKEVTYTTNLRSFGIYWPYITSILCVNILNKLIGLIRDGLLDFYHTTNFL